jgi:hypothetical protein
MATYKAIADRVKLQAGFVPKTCWIADIKSQYDLITRQAPNRFNPNSREHPCPPDKRSAIESAMRFFQMI